MSFVHSSTTRGGGRVSLACIPCRTRHVRCDAKRPICNRCSADTRECYYVESRRGGLTREALAKRRDQDAVRKRSSSHRQQRQSASSQLSSYTVQLRQDIDVSQTTLQDDRVSLSGTNTSTTSKFVWGTSASSSSVSSTTPSGDYILNDPCIDLYYEYFHHLHPCVLPRKALEKMLVDETQSSSLQPLLAVMRFIGSLYGGSSNVDSTERELPSHAVDEQCHRSNAFMAQYYLLYSIALYWCGKELRSREEMDRAIDLAIELGMHQADFAIKHGRGDAVLQECWRRTWWQIYVVDAYYAAMQHTWTSLTSGINMSTYLPCEEREYESGVIPTPKTLDDFTSRDFASDDHVYSSFAYLIGAVHGLLSAISRNFPESPEDTQAHHLEAADVVMDGWFLLLPQEKREIMSSTGEFDELMFQAHMAIHATAVGLHRRFSSLFLDPTEAISRCPTTAPEFRFRCPSEPQNVHTARCLKAIESQARLLVLPTMPLTHSPFVVCMIVTGTISLLSACKFHFSGRRVVVARDQIRMSIGWLRSFATVWSRAERNRLEVQTIAREVLAPPEKSHAHGQTTDDVLLSHACGQPGADAHNDNLAELSEQPPSTPSFDTLSTFLSFVDPQQDASMWFSQD